MKRQASLLVIAALLTQGPASAVAPEQQQQRGASGGFCRQPAPLPDLGPEARPQQQRPERPSARDYPASPPAPAMSAESADSSGEMVVTAKRAEPSLSAAAPVSVAEAAAAAPAAKVMAPTGRSRLPYPYPPRPPRPQPQPQAGLLTAGEHDDLLNPELYADYVRRANLGQEIRELPRLDTGRVLTVEVRDRGGQPVRGAQVEVICSDGNRLLMPTMADGTVTLFPQFDRLSPTVRIAAAGQEERTVTIPRGAGGQKVTFALNSMNTVPPPSLDLMLVIDTTGSMGDEIRYLQAELGSIVDALRARHRGLDLRVGFVFYRDIGDEYVTATVPLSADITAAQGELAQRWAGGGGDYPEAMDQALVRAAQQRWRPGAVKSLLLVADAPPHDENFGLAWRAAEHLRQKRVHVVPVAASGVADKAEYAMRAMAALTQSRYTFLTDDSGIGNPHAKPAIDCYLVTRLDALLRRVIDSQLSGRRIEPDKAEVIREVGDYDGGRCVLPRGWQTDRQQDQ